MIFIDFQIFSVFVWFSCTLHESSHVIHCGSGYSHRECEKVRDVFPYMSDHVRDATE